MKKGYKILLFIAIALFIAIIIKILSPEKEFKRHTFPETLNVNNFTDHRYVDTMTMIVLHKIYGYDTMSVNIFNLNANIDNEIDFAAHIMKYDDEEHAYGMYIVENPSISLSKIISHELIHLKQFEDGNLKHISDDNSKMIYLNDTIDLNAVDYFDREFEIDAFSKQNKIHKQLKSQLYVK